MERHEDTAAPGSFVKCEHTVLLTVLGKLGFPAVPVLFCISPLSCIQFNCSLF